MSKDVLETIVGALGGYSIGTAILWVYIALNWRREFKEPLPRDMHWKLGAAVAFFATTSLAVGLWAAA